MKFKSIIPILFIIFAPHAQCVPKAKPLTPAVDAEQPLLIELEASRSQLVAGEGLGVIARIRNTSKKAIYLSESSFALTIPLEMEGKRASVGGIPALFPTEIHLQSKEGDPPVPSEQYYQAKIKLNPGDSYSAYWTNTYGDNPKGLISYVFDQITSQFQFLFFFPGKYSITLNAKYWSDPKLPSDDYRLSSTSISLPVVAPLFVILLGSALGGLIAYSLFPQAVYKFSASDTFLGSISKRLAGLVGAALLSIIVTIALSRVSETHFLVTVTVNDVWGAIVTGFVANYAGYKILQKIIPGQGGSDERQSTEQSGRKITST